MNAERLRAPTIAERHLRLVQPAVAALALLLAFAETRGDSLVAILMYGLVPVAAAAILTSWIEEADRMRGEMLAAGDRGDKNLEPADELRRSRKQLFWIWLTLEAATILALVLALHELDIAEVSGNAPTADFDDPEWPLGLWAFSLFFAGIQALKSWKFRRTLAASEEHGGRASQA